MLTINWAKIDKFYLVLSGVLILLAVMVIFTAQGIFSAFLTASELGQRDAGKQLTIDARMLDEAYTFALEKEEVPLEIR